MMESDEDEEQDPLIDAIKRRDVDEVRRLLAAGGDPNESWDRDSDIQYRSELQTHGLYALHSACHLGYTEIVRMLLDAGADPNITDEFRNLTPLMVTSSTEIASMLLDAGADVTLRNFDALRSFDERETALDIAIRHQNQAMVELLQRVQLERDRQRVNAHYERMKSGLKIFVKRGGTVPPRSVKRALSMAVEDDDLEVLHAILNQF